jgi:Predicted outer membrane lipoprotein
MKAARNLFLSAALAASTALAGCQSSSTPYGHTRNHEFGCMAGTVGGAIIGGLVGSTIGSGRGSVLATAAGIGAGGLIGNRLAC